MLCLSDTDKPGFKIDVDLLQKYDVPGPRYTSYPTALHFDAGVNRETLLKDSIKQDGLLSLYFHLPFCQSRCWFCGCTKIITKNQALADTYINYLEQEIQLFTSLLKRDRKVIQLHFGGGTPNFFSPEQINRLGRIIHRHFDFAPEAEISVELDPRTLTEDHVGAFCNLGVNRASIGVQDCNLAVQQAIHRVQSPEQNKEAVNWLRQANIESFNLDLVYGLPYQTVENFKYTLEEALSYDPDRFAVFSYAHMPAKMPAQRIVARHPLPTATTKLKLLQLIIETLTSHGYTHIGMDHFAKTTDSLVRAQKEKTLQRNFQGYSTQAKVEVCAFGLSAISQTAHTYRQNVKDLKSYYAALDAEQLPIERGYCLMQEDEIRRTIIMRLMCDMSLDFSQISDSLNISFREHCGHSLSALEKFVDDGLLLIDDHSLQVTAQGRYFIRNIAMCFDEYLKSNAYVHSRTV